MRTELQNQNLRKLAEGLLGLPDNYTGFNMSDYFYNNNQRLNKTQEPYEAIQHINECGTIACAAGHGPMFGIAPLPKENWSQYAERNFTEDDDEWEWMFSGSWSDEEIGFNTAKHAAMRILALLDGDISILIGEGDPYSYEKEYLNQLMKDVLEKYNEHRI